MLLIVSCYSTPKIKFSRIYNVFTNAFNCFMSFDIQDIYFKRLSNLKTLSNLGFKMFLQMH